MKVLRLEFQGFGPYLARQEIDFTDFDGDIFVITGKTGAGKSTVLDAICFALYDNVPRYGGGSKQVRSDFCTVNDPTEVTLEFEAPSTTGDGLERYRIRRSPEFERPKKRGDGTTTQSAEATLWVERGGDWEALAVRPVEVGTLVGQIMRLNASQFLQVILLAQGRFQEFLVAKSDERLKVLRSLFGTDRFEALERQIADVAKERGRVVEAADAALAGIVSRAAGDAGVGEPETAEREEWFAATAALLSTAQAEAEQRSAAAAKAATEAAEALHQAESAHTARQRLTAAQDELAALEARAEEHTSQAERLARAEQARHVAAPLAAHMEADIAVERARAARDAAAAEAGEAADASLQELRDRMGELDGQRGSLATALELERSLDTLRDTAEVATSTVKAAETAIAAAKTEREALPERIREVREKLETAQATAARLADLEAAEQRARDREQAHEQVEALETEHRRQLDEEANASGERLRDARRHDDLIQRRLASQAAHLARELSPGDPCPVCGATEHPRPAEASDDHVSDEDVEAAAAQVAASAGVLERATAAREETSKALSAAQSLAGEGDADQARAAVLAAREEVEAAEEATRVVATLTEELGELDRASVQADAQVESAQEALAKAQQDLVAATSALDSARAAVEQARGEFESVAERHTALGRSRAQLEAVATALEAHDQAVRAHAQAEKALSTAIDESAFEDAAEARAAALPTSELDALRKDVEDYKSELARTRGVVAELSERDLPEEPEDLEALRSLAQETASARDEATAASATMRDRATRFAAAQKEFAEQGAQSLEARQARDVAATLAASLKGDPPNTRKIRLESFVLAAKLERIVAAANARLTVMSNGQYTLEHDDDRQRGNVQTGLGLRIADAHTGQSRSTQSLSGGESFLASLSLALGLAETVTAEAGGIQLSTLFIDEGFGSLDGDTLEVAMSTLDELRSGGRTIGLISHVEAMKEAIPSKLEVRKRADGSSEVFARASGVAE